jgi:amino acid transporter/mannitol/fructose-specific phosphotransferase system IIA component (Ntr-type)
MGLKDKDLQLKKKLGLLEVFCIASGAMISSGLFILPGIAYSKAGPSVIFSYVLASIIIIPTLLSNAELATAMPKAGGDYFFIDRSMGPATGTIGGLASWFSLTSKTAFALLGIGIFISLINPGFSEMHIKLFAVLFCIFFTIINLHGVEHTGKAQNYLVLVLLALIIFYIIVGAFFVKASRFTPFTPFGIAPIFATAGLVFISYMGLTKVCSVAEEVENPARNIPLGLFLSWGIVSTLYALVVLVTVGILDHSELIGPSGEAVLIPISLGAKVFLGDIGLIVMAIAAILAFVSTANAGILSASRYPMAMGKDHLLPAFLSRISKRGTPVLSIIFTSTFMICLILFLNLENLVKTASTLVLLLFVFINLSLIIMRESKIRNYRPKFKCPFYPWIQIAGIFGYFFLIIEMGLLPIFLVCCFIVLGFLWYWFFARDKIWREYTLLNCIERVTGQKSTGYLVDEELREIIIERDELTEENFKKIIKEAEVIEVYKYSRPDKFIMNLAEILSSKLNLKTKKLYRLLKRRSSDSNVAIHPGVAIFSNMISGKEKFAILLVRSKMGMVLSDRMDPIHAFFVIVSSPDKKNLYLHTLMWIIRVTGDENFDEKWIKAKDPDELKNLILKIWKNKKEL